MLVTFEREQKNALLEGEALRQLLWDSAVEAVGLETMMKYRHTMITGDAGTGKTWSVMKAAAECGHTVFTIQGQASLFGMAQSLAVLKAKNFNNPVIVIIDDCDFMFNDADSINAMKKILVAEDPAFEYGKSINLNVIPEGPKRDAMELFMNDEQQGFRIPLDNFHFVFTSNAQLPTKKFKKELLIKSKGMMTPKIEKIDHLLAIRSRLNYKSVNTDKNGMWGSIAHVLLSDGVCPELSEQEKMFLLNWMWEKWDDMTETSVRTAEKMAEDLIRVGIEQVKDRWSYNFLD